MNRVIKIGSSSLFDKEASLAVFDAIAEFVASTKEKDRTVVVSSGAIAFGRSILKIPTEKILTVPEKQANAAVGQPYLMIYWREAFAKYGIKVAQVLVTNEVLTGRLSEQRSHLEDVFGELFKAGIVPIVNENDAVAVAEIVQGDNDKLGALIANIIGAGELYLLGTAQAIYDDYRLKKGRLKYISLNEIERLRRISTDTTDPQARGGMKTKIDAAEIFLTKDNENNKKSVYIASAKSRAESTVSRNVASGTKVTLRPF